jgi:hypothetical protein
MLVQHSLLCMICCLRIFVCIVYYLLQFESVRARVEFKAVAAVSGLPYILMYWLFALIIANWASIYFAAKKNTLQAVAAEFQKMRKIVIGSGSVVTLIFGSLFVTIAMSTDAELRQSITLAGSAMLACIAFVLSVVYAGFGYGLLVQLSKDFKSTSAERLCKVGIVFCVCFIGEAVIWLLSAIDPQTFFANFEAVNSVFFLLDIVALICIVLVSFKSLKVGIKARAEQRRKMRIGMSTTKKQKTRKARTGMSKAGMKGKTVGSTGVSQTTAGSTELTNDTNSLWRGKRGGGAELKTETGFERKSGKHRTKLDQRAERFRRPLFELSTMDPDDDGYDARSVASAIANLRLNTMETKVETNNGVKQKVGNWRRFSRENEKGDLVIDMDAVADVADERLKKYQHWFENLPSDSDVSTVSSLSPIDDDAGASAKVKQKKKEKKKKSVEKTMRVAPNLSTGLSAEAASLISRLTGEATNAKAAASKVSSSDSSSSSSFMSLSSSSAEENSVLDNFSFSDSSSSSGGTPSSSSFDFSVLYSSSLSTGDDVGSNRSAEKISAKKISAKKNVEKRDDWDDFSFSDYSSNISGVSSLSSFVFSFADSGSSYGSIGEEGGAAAINKNARGTRVNQLYDALQFLDLSSMSSDDAAVSNSRSDSVNGDFAMMLEKYLARIDGK